MKHWRPIVGFVAVGLGCSLAWAQDPAIVFVDEAQAGAKSIMVMDADGSNRREVFRTERRFCDCSGPALGPSISPDGSWVTYVKTEVWKAPATGGDPEVLLCAEESEGWVSPTAAQWSPDGEWVAIQVWNFRDYTEWMIFVHRDQAVDCPFNLGTIDAVQIDHEFDSRYAGVTWSPTANEIAILEVDLAALTDYLTILDRWTGGMLARYPIEWPDGVVGGNVDMELARLEWHPSGDLMFSFDSLDKIWILTVDEVNRVAVADLLADGRSPTWSPDGTQLLFGGTRYWENPDTLTRITLTGGTEFLGTGYDPDWRRAVPECSSDNSCSGDLVCCGGSCVPSKCEPDPNCSDGEACTTDSCDPCVGCIFTPIPDCGPPVVDCSEYFDPASCTAFPECKWHPRKGCMSR